MKEQLVDIKPNNYPIWLSNFMSVYQRLNTSNLNLLKNIYHDDIKFIDPMHHIDGFDNLYQYFENLYRNLSACTFIIDEVFYDGEQAAIYWQMKYQHPKLNGGADVMVFGHSHIKGEQEKVIFHRDYLDLGAMLYEQLPVFGKLTKWLKKKATA